VFWDSSALVPLLLPEARSVEITSLLDSDPEPAIWWASPVECRSAIHRRHREKQVQQALLGQAIDRLDAISQDVDTVTPSEAVRLKAGRMLAVHPLRAADALQLASALVWCRDQPYRQKFVCLDKRLSEAALKEGFEVLPSG